MKGAKVISLIGMSNMGKSYWAERLVREQGYQMISIDREIQAELAPVLVRDGYAGADALANWIGFPDNARYAANDDMYLRLEEEFTRGAIDRVKGVQARFVLDLTGSVIYLKMRTLALLRRHTTVVLLKSSKEHLAEMRDLYFHHPKPVHWGDAYSPLSGEDPHETLRRCYPALVSWRTSRYKVLAHVAIAHDRHKSPDYSAKKLVRDVKRAIREKEDAERTELGGEAGTVHLF